MFEVKKQDNKPVTIIRAATENELSLYEKNKLATIEENAHENKIELIRLKVEGTKQQIKPINKEIELELGGLATKSIVTPNELSKEDLFIIECALDATDLH